MNKVEEALCLMHSMINCGESFTITSESVFQDALAIVRSTPAPEGKELPSDEEIAREANVGCCDDPTCNVCEAKRMSFRKAILWMSKWLRSRASLTEGEKK